MRAADPKSVRRSGRLVVATWDDPTLPSGGGWEWFYDVPRTGEDSILSELYDHAYGRRLPAQDDVLKGSCALLSQWSTWLGHPAGVTSKIRQLRCIWRGWRAAREFARTEKEVRDE